MALDVVLVGAARRPEFRAAVQVLEESCRLVSVPDPASALGLLAGGAMVPDLIVVLRNRCGQFAAEAIDALRSRAPLSRLVVVVGSWCEGETRSVAPWASEIRLYWHQAAERLRRELAELAANRCPVWSLPATATDDERLLWIERPDAVSHPAPRGTIALVSRSQELADWLSAALRGQGWRTARSLPGEPIRGVMSLVLWDMQRFGDAELAEFAHWRTSAADCPALVLAGFPRLEDAQRAHAAGATALVSKPLSLADLCDWIRRHAVARS